MNVASTLRKRISDRKLLSAAVAATALVCGSTAFGGVLFDDVTPFENGTAPTNAGLENGKYGYVGGVFNLANSGSGAATAITGYDLVGYNGSVNTYADVDVIVYIWGTVNTGTVNSSHPAFSNLLSASGLVLSASDLGYSSIAPGDYVDLEYNGTQPAIVFGSPISLAGSTEVGVTVSIQGSTNGTTFNTASGLSTLVGTNAPPVAGAIGKSGYYGNSVATDTNGNFTSTIKNYNTSATNTNTAPLMRLFGTFAPVNYQWNLSGGGTWEAPGSWNPNTLAGGPTDSDTADFNLNSSAGYTVTINSSSDTCNNLNVENDNVNLSLVQANTGALTVVGTLTVGQPPTSTTTGTTVGSLTLSRNGTSGFVGVVANSVVVGPTGGIGKLTVGTGVLLQTNFNVSMGAQSTLVLQNGSLLATQGLSLAGTTGAWTSTVDVTSAYVVLPGNDLADTTNQVAQGYNLIGGANWNGPGGILSTVAAADTAHLTAVGVIQNNQSGTPLYGNPTTNSLPAFGNYYPGEGDILVKYTYYGDANLDGVVDGSDYSLIDAGYASGGTLTGWYNGDFNYDGVVDGSDYALIDNAYNNQGNEPVSNFQTAPAAVETAEVAPLAAVPEPGSIAAGLAGLMLTAIRRKRRERI